MHFTKDQMHEIFGQGDFDLPVQRGNQEYSEYLNEILGKYKFETKPILDLDERKLIRRICKLIILSIKHYHNGFPHKSFNTFKRLMNVLNDSQPIRYQKTGLVNHYNNCDPLKLYRIRHSILELNERKDIFHTPHKYRNKVSTGRYSISGYPSLYLGTSLDICLHEVPKTNELSSTYASKFEIKRNYNDNDFVDVTVIEFGIKPSDFFVDIPIRVNMNWTDSRLEHLNEVNLDDAYLRGDYVKWYPLFLACSFVRINKEDPFASEYIIPQLMMQWLRTQAKDSQVVGLRYFPCSSIEVSSKGMNYVFPVSSDKEARYHDYCKLLSSVFKLTEPKGIETMNLDNEQLDIIENDRMGSI